MSHANGNQEALSAERDFTHANLHRITEYIFDFVLRFTTV